MDVMEDKPLLVSSAEPAEPAPARPNAAAKLSMARAASAFVVVVVVMIVVIVVVWCSCVVYVGDVVPGTGEMARGCDAEEQEEKEGAVNCFAPRSHPRIEDLRKLHPGIEDLRNVA